MDNKDWAIGFGDEREQGVLWGEVLKSGMRVFNQAVFSWGQQ
jgi:hypothetical protein